MTESEPRSALWEEMVALRPAIAAAHAKANREALLEHARMGRSVSTMRDGQVVWITPAVRPFNHFLIALYSTFLNVITLPGSCP